jgi:hypothetical protein
MHDFGFTRDTESSAQFNWANTFTKILNADFDTIMPKRKAKKLSMLGTVAWGIFGLLSLGGLYQNFGYTVMTYDSAKKASKTLAKVIAAIQLIPTLGFAIKGILGDRDMISDYMSGTKSLEAVEEPNKLLALSILTAVIAMGSGFTGDQANYQAWKECNGPWGESGAWASGIIGNIATATTYNGPQALLFSKRCLHLYMLRKDADPELKAQMLFVDGMRSMSNTIQMMTMDRFEEFVKTMPMPLSLSFDRLCQDKLATTDYAMLQQVKSTDSAAAIKNAPGATEVPAPAGRGVN